MTDSFQVTLPDGKIVIAPSMPQAWWTQDGGTGFINPNLLAPDPHQPRRDMNTAELEELSGSVKEKGVREPIAVTPRELAPWVILKEEFAHLPFVVVSGHRRRLTALTNSLLAVPVRVIVYDSEPDYMLDASILNKGRAELTALEEGQEMVRLREKGVTIEKLTRAFGYSAPKLYLRMNLTRLAHSIQALLNLGLPKKERITPAVGGMLGSVGVPTVEELEELHVLFKADINSVDLPEFIPKQDFYELDDEDRRFEMQKILFAAIKHRHLGAARATNLIQEHKLQLESTHTDMKTQRFQPYKRKEVMRNLTKEIAGTTLVDWTPAEFERIFENDNLEEVEKYRIMFHRAATTLSDLEKMLRSVYEKKGGKPASEVVSLRA